MCNVGSAIHSWICFNIFTIYTVCIRTFIKTFHSLRSLSYTSSYSHRISVFVSSFSFSYMAGGGATYLYKVFLGFSTRTQCLSGEKKIYFIIKICIFTSTFLLQFCSYVELLLSESSGECGAYAAWTNVINGAWGSECLCECIIVIIIKKICFIYFISGAPDHSPDAHTEIIRIHFQVSRAEDLLRSAPTVLYCLCFWQ